MKMRTWDPSKGDLLQGDVCLFRVPNGLEISMAEEILARGRRLILAEGEITGHHHAIRLPQPALFRDDGLARELEAKAPAATTKLYRDVQAVQELVRLGELTSERLALGFLVVTGGAVILRHEEHEAIRIPPGRYYVGGQREWDAAEERRVQD